jgi:hypothetical protein
LHPGARADADTLLDFRKRPDKAIIADVAAIEIAGFDDLGPRTKFDVADASLMQVRFVHDTTPRRLRRGVKCSGTSRPVSIDS